MGLITTTIKYKNNLNFEYIIYITTIYKIIKDIKNIAYIQTIYSHRRLIII